jgi:hypothetical protein
MIRLLFFFVFLYLMYRLVSGLFRLPPGPMGPRGSYYGGRQGGRPGGRRPPGGAFGGAPGGDPPTTAGKMVKCAACGLYVPEESAIRRRRGGKTVYFCSPACERRGAAD